MLTHPRSLAGISYALTESVLLDEGERALVRNALALVIARHTRQRDRARAKRPLVAAHHQTIIERARRLRDNL